LDSIKEKNKGVAASQYGLDWIQETWGWDTPEEFIRSQGHNLRPRVRYSLDIANLLPGMRVLDVGCGRGEVVLYCARKGIEAVGVDYSQEVLDIAEHAKRTHTNEEQGRMKFICGDVKSLEAEEPFDRVFMLDFVEHLYDWELNEVFQICKKLLKPEGQIIIHTLPNRWLYEITYRRLLRLAMPWLPRNPRNEKEMAIHINEMSLTHLYELLRHNGFNCRIWLHDLIVNQARWHARHGLKDKRGTLYQWIKKPLVAMMYRSLTLTPLRLLIVNDIFAVAVQQGESISFRWPMRRNWTESLVCRLSSRGSS
jgi:2-polyprenyl-3-methyl-5-hydroxy-6-metoxy-1,4-benzoquinol methylase